ncbi:acyl-CoA N-acyltransferase [Mycena albidolilacea]|uniref:Acyl-CoA N-acyltransferase n=1 Tax=Mycena albidolilacea TaxID=1033008 RepID=A0AAD7A308_9AGAR|nr:acyl-CoA N-acyltransferase [Mycena albidolilacea]
MASDDLDIYIRQYRPSDFPQVRVLFLEGFVTGERSVLVTATRNVLMKAPVVAVYLLSICGAALLYSLSHWDSFAGCLAVLLVSFSPALILFLRHTLNKAMKELCDQAFATDMRDISAYYAAPAGFFVAARRAGDETTGEEVLGFVGFEYQPEKTPHTAELRRMVVSPKYGRRGIAKRLVRALIEHAEAVPGLDFIELGTSEFQPAARRLYEGLGWELTRIDIQRAAFVTASMIRFRRPVERKLTRE